MSKQLEPKYNHHKVEEGKYQHWIDKKYFEAGDTSKKPYAIVIPPPNVTGKLHLGHAWDTTANFSAASINSTTSWQPTASNASLT